MYEREPCCWKWHSSRNQRSMSSFLARRRSFFICRLRAGIGMRDDTTRLAAPESELSKKPLALPDSEMDSFFLPKMMAEEFSIPDVLVIAKSTRRTTQVFSKRFERRVIEDARTPGAQALLKSCEPALLEAANPVLDRARTVPQHLTDFVAVESVTDEQNAVETVVVARFFRPHDLLLNRDLVDVSMLDFQSAHGTLLSAYKIAEGETMRKYL